MASTIKKIGKFNLIKDNHPCTEPCDCGWNIQIGGKDEKDYKAIKIMLENWGNKVTTEHE